MPITPRTHNSATIKNQMADVHSPADGLADGLETVCVCGGGKCVPAGRFSEDHRGVGKL